MTTRALEQFTHSVPVHGSANVFIKSYFAAFQYRFNLQSQSIKGAILKISGPRFLLQFECLPCLNAFGSEALLSLRHTIDHIINFILYTYI